uniref:Uncharacterized protein n=1 Tax=Solanum tuberosum TaxID=4113 RepID=M1DGN6_SOLTU
MSALFGNSMPPPDSSPAAGKRPHSDHTADTEKAPRLSNKERQQFEEASRASILAEERRQHRDREMNIDPSGCVSTTKGASLFDESGTDGTPRVDPAGFGKPDPPTS